MRKSGAYIFITALKLFSLVNKLNTGCGAVRLAYTAGGRVVAGSNPVIPTFKVSNDSEIQLII